MAIKRAGLSDKLTAFLRDQSFVCDVTGPGTAQLVMLRGCKINANGSLSAHGDPQVYTDNYDDTLVVYGQKITGTPFLEAFRASAKPGMAWIKHSSYASAGSGCPTVQPGQYAYCRGDHRGHEAMRQVSGCPVCVIRDLDDDARLEASDLVDYPMWTGINIHAGGVSSKVGLNSSGCQVIWGGWQGTPWKTFHWLIYTVAKKQQVFHYALVDFMTFATWHDAGPVRLLMFGSVGEDVRELQERLMRAGFFAAALVDGKFGRGTDRALRAWQKAQGMKPTGIARLS